MDNDTTPQNSERKPKRPRIGMNRAASSDPQSSQRFTRPEGSHNDYEPRQERTYYNRRPNHQSDSYNAGSDYQHQQHDGEEGGNQRSYQQRSYQQRGFQNRQNGNAPRQNSYNNGSRQGSSYQQRQGGYQQRPYQNRDGEEGGYNQRTRQDGTYGSTASERQGGYQKRQGGYNNGGQRRQGGFQKKQGGYQQRPGGQHPGSFAKGKSFTPRPKQVEYDIEIPNPDDTLRLNKFMSNAGICSRREADDYIQRGLVRVNGQVVTELGTKIKHSDVVEYDEKVVAMERKCYILLNKPKDCVTTSEDPNGRTTVLDLVKGACKERIYPVGRLDRNTTGVLLLTNDGDLASKLTHPKFVKKKIYHVWTDKDISEEDMQRIADGIELSDGEIHADAISYVNDTDRNQAGIEIHSGRNRIVRRIFETLGYRVVKLDRVYFAGLTKKNLPRGRWRYLTQEEVNYLKMGSFE